MSKLATFVIKRWKLLLNITTVIALLMTLYFIRHDLVATLRNLLHVNGFALLLMVPLEVLNYHAQTKLYQRLFAIVGNKIEYKTLLKTTSELNFVNHVFPSGGVAGISYFGFRLRGTNITGAKATLVQFIKLLLIVFSFEALILLGVIFLAIGGRVNNFTILVSGVLATLLLVGSALFIYIIGNRQRINSFLAYFAVLLNRLWQMVQPGKDAINMKKARSVFDDFHYTFLQMRYDQRRMRPAFIYALLMNLTEVAVVYSVFVAFGHFINPGAVILAYGIANIAGFISVLPGGVGIYEALMIAVLLTAGISPKLSLPVIIMYRVLNTILQLPAGYYLYQKEVGRHGHPPQPAEIL